MVLPRDDVSLLTPEHRAIYERAAREYDTPKDKMRLLAYLETADWDEDIAHEKMEDLQELIAKTPVPTIAQVRRFYEPEADGTPPPCMILLENDKGECARAADGTPIIVSFGTMRGNTEEMIQQCGYVFSRLDKHISDTEAPRATFVLDLLPRAGRHETRGPDTVLGEFLMKFPMTAESYTCGVEAWMESAIEAGRKLMPVELLAKHRVNKDYVVLVGGVDAANRLPAWDGGTFDFDLPRLVAHLEREEAAGR